MILHIGRHGRDGAVYAWLWIYDKPTLRAPACIETYDMGMVKDPFPRMIVMNSQMTGSSTAGHRISWGVARADVNICFDHRLQVEG